MFDFKSCLFEISELILSIERAKPCSSLISDFFLGGGMREPKAFSLSKLNPVPPPSLPNRPPKPGIAGGGAGVAGSAG